MNILLVIIDIVGAFAFLGASYFAFQNYERLKEASQLWLYYGAASITAWLWALSVMVNEIVVIESGVARCTITIAKCTFAIASRNAGLVWRHNGLTGLSANWYQAKWNGTTNTFTIERWDSGILGATLVSVGAISAPVDNVFILIVGNTYSVYQDGVFLATVTDATYPTNTKHGFMSGLSNGPLIDNYKVTPLE